MKAAAKHGDVVNIRDERGSATLWIAALLLVLWATIFVAVVIGAVVRASTRARTAADLAALAGAGTLLRHRGDPCASAESVARANRVVLRRCVVEGSDVRVWTEVDVSPLGPWDGSIAHARSRAGPAARPVIG